MDALELSGDHQIRNEGPCERLTRNATLFVHKKRTKADLAAIRIMDAEMGSGRYRLSESAHDPYDVRPRLEAGRGSVYRGVERIQGLFEAIRSLSTIA